MALLEDYSTPASQQDVLEILHANGDVMDARRLIDMVHDEKGTDREAVRRAILRLSTNGQTEYTSDWQVRFVGK